MKVNEEVFPLGGEYTNKNGERMQNYGVSLHGFVRWYLREYPECTECGCGAFYSYVNSNEYAYYPHYSCWETILQELFPQEDGEARTFLEEWMGVKVRSDSIAMAKARRKYMERILAREDRILVCPCCVR